MLSAPCRKSWLRIPSYAGGTQAEVAYTIDTAQVATEVEHFSDRTLRSWIACLAEIALDPFPRFDKLVAGLLRRGLVRPTIHGLSSMSIVRT